MKKMIPVAVLAAMFGYFVGRNTQGGDVAYAQAAAAQQPQAGQPEVLPFGFNRPGLQPLAPDAPPPTHWSIRSEERRVGKECRL